MPKLTPQIKKKIMSRLTNVLDPELHLSIVDLGLVYDVRESRGKLKITMTLTTIGCPLFSLIKDRVVEELEPLGYTEDSVDIALTFDPPWSMEKISESAKATLGIN